MYNNEKIFYCWLAGLTDADGCISIPMSLRKSKLGMCIEIRPQIRIALKENDYKTIEYILDMCRVGKIYYSNKGKPHGICAWQTTKLNDAIFIIQKLLPHLRLKKKKAEMFLKCMLQYKANFNKNGNRSLGNVRSKEMMLELATVSTSINYDRQTKRYRNYKNYEYWEKIINELYR